MRIQPHRERFRGVPVIFLEVFTTKIVRSLERFLLCRSHGVAANSKPSAMKLHAIIAAGATREPTDSACFAWITSTGQGLPACMKCQTMFGFTPTTLPVTHPAAQRRNFRCLGMCASFVGCGYQASISWAGSKEGCWQANRRWLSCRCTRTRRGFHA